MSKKLQKITPKKLFELKNNPLCIFHKGEPKSILNKELIQRQSLTETDVEELKKLHIEKLNLYDLINSTNDKKLLKQYVADIEQIEFSLQKVWKFEQNRNYHEWYYVPRCKCPKSDNAEIKGYDRRIINSKCPLHGIELINEI
jgi:t-SNARE complex subunit (syntaxin)